MKNYILMVYLSKIIGIVCHQHLMVFHHDDATNYLNKQKKCPSFEPYTYVIVTNSTDEQKNKISRFSSNVSNSKDVNTLLDHVNWKIFVYSSQKNCNNITQSGDKQNNYCLNGTYCLTDSVEQIVLNGTYRDDTEHCSSIFDPYPIALWYIVLLFGFICIFGNLVVIFDKVTSLTSKLNVDKQVQIYYTLVLNLAIADVLMGVYLTAIAFEIKYKVTNDYLYSKPILCNGLGVINVVSSQVSITVLFIISFCRLFGVIQPYKSQSLRLIVTSLIVTWIAWLGLAVLPILPWEPLKSTFTVGIARDSCLKKDLFIEFAAVLPFIKILLNLASTSNATEIHSVLYAVTKFPTLSVLKKFSAAVNWLDSEREQWFDVGYYHFQYTCATSYFAPSFYFYHPDYNYFTLFCILYNFTFSTIISMVYAFVSFKISENEIAAFFSSCSCPCKFCKCLPQINAFSDPPNRIRRAENQKLYKRISVILFTDMLCWIPLSVASLVVWSNFSFVPRNTTGYVQWSVAFETATLFVIPLNSILNPCIYSYHLWKHWYNKIQAILGSKKFQNTEVRIMTTTT